MPTARATAVSALRSACTRGMPKPSGILFRIHPTNLKVTRVALARITRHTCRLRQRRTSPSQSIVITQSTAIHCLEVTSNVPSRSSWLYPMSDTEALQRGMSVEHTCGLCEKKQSMTLAERESSGWELWSDGVLGSAKNQWMCPDCIAAMHRVAGNRRKWFQ